MTGKNRIESSDRLYRIINRGNHPQSTFETEGAKDGFEQFFRKHVSGLAGMTHEGAARSRYLAQWKPAIVSKLKREILVTNGWLAQNLAMGVPNSVSNLCGVYCGRRGRASRRSEETQKNEI